MKKCAPLVIFIIALFSGSVQAEDRSTHYSAAKQFYESTNVVNDEALLDQIVTSILSNSPEMNPFRDILTDLMREVIQSEKYEDIKIRSYMAYLSEKDLVELTTLFSSEAYRKLRVNQVNMIKISNEGILGLWQQKQGELERRIQARVNGEE